MATHAQILAAIVAKLSALDVGQVHDYERYAQDEAGLRALYESQATIKGWFVYREATRERDLNNSEVQRLHVWRLIGFLGLSDAAATGKIIQDDVEAIAAAFRTDRTLGGLVDDIKDLEQESGESGIQVDAVEPVLFAGVLCHRARLRLATDGVESSV